MKKLLFLLFLIYNYSFADYCPIKQPSLFPYDYLCTDGSYHESVNVYGATIATCLRTIVVGVHCEDAAFLQQQALDNLMTPNSTCFINSSGVIECANNLDPLGGHNCRDLFQKDGQAYTCNPNTNEASIIPNSDGTILDENGDDVPNCNSGYDYTSIPTMSTGGGGAGTYNAWGCSSTSGTSGNTGNTSGTSGTSEPSVTTNFDGSKTWNSPDGNSYNLTSNGTLTTTYSDGSTSVKQVGSDYSAGGSGGSSGGTGTSGGGTSGNTTNEDNTTPPTDTPIDNTPVANSCTDSALTLQEKMLCELNAGMKKVNSEGNPQNSLNQLLKDLKTSNQTDNTAINTNLKDVKALQENQLNKQIQANATLEKINDSANASELYNKVMNDGINKISGTLDVIAEFVTTVSDFVNDPSQIGDLMNNKLGEVSNKYQNKILNDSCGVCPTISIPYHGTNVTLLNQTLLDTYFPIAMMKTIIILIFAFSGFMNFFRSNN